MDRTPRNPSDVVHVAMTADALRIVRNALAENAAEHEHLAVRAQNAGAANVHRAAARLNRGVRDDLTAIFNGDDARVAGETFIAQRAATR